MPILRLDVAPPQPVERQRSLAAALTAITVALLGKRAQSTAVVIQDVPTARWFIGGEAVPGATALLELSITAGTNTESQKAAFIDAAFAELQRQLAPDGALDPASYVVARELPATDWGYGGRTQHARLRERVPSGPPS